MTSIRENRLFVGNPGTGKSTLINCLLGNKQFQSGISWGGGLTTDFQRFERDGIAYMDTPGLADEVILERAAQMITTALKQGGSYKLFFMVRLQNGRVVSEDISTLERVLDSIDAGDLNYKFTVLMNCVAPRQYEVLKSRGDEFETIKRLVNHRYKTDSFCFVPLIEELLESEAVVKLPADVYAFMNNEAPVVRIDQKQVKPIELDGFANQTQEIRRELEQLRKEQAKWLAAMHEQEKRHEAALERERARYTVEIEKMNRGEKGKGASLSPAADFRSHPVSPNGLMESQSKPSLLTRRKRVLLIVAILVLLVVGITVIAVKSKGTTAATADSPPGAIASPAPAPVINATAFDTGNNPSITEAKSVLPHGCLSARQSPQKEHKHELKVCFDTGIATQTSVLGDEITIGTDMVYDPIFEPGYIFFKRGAAGNGCPDGRSLAIEVSCASGVALTRAVESAPCTYSAVLETPGIC